MRVIKIIAITFLLTSTAFAYKSMEEFEDNSNYYTGSPRYSDTCAQCHTGTAVGDVFALDFPGLVWSGSSQAFLYTPSQTTSLVVRLLLDRGTGEEKAQNGFVVEILDASGNPAGTLIPDTTTQTSTDGTIIMDIDDPSTKKAQWTFQWTAPGENTGDLTLYSSGVDGDGDGDGDEDGDVADSGSVKLIETPLTPTPTDSGGCMVSVKENGTKTNFSFLLFSLTVLSGILFYSRKNPYLI